MSKERVKPKWTSIDPTTEVMSVTGGWLYRTNVAMCFVPYPPLVAGEIPTTVPPFASYDV